MNLLWERQTVYLFRVGYEILIVFIFYIFFYYRVDKFLLNVVVKSIVYIEIQYTVRFLNVDENTDL